MFMREREETNPEIFIPEDITAAKALLDTPITEIEIRYSVAADHF